MIRLVTLLWPEPGVHRYCLGLCHHDHWRVGAAVPDECGAILPFISSAPRRYLSCLALANSRPWLERVLSESITLCKAIFLRRAVLRSYTARALGAMGGLYGSGPLLRLFASAFVAGVYATPSILAQIRLVKAKLNRCLD